jgi:hypothetical protein
MQKTQKFKIEIWFNQAPNKIKLGSVNIYADSEKIALELAQAHTEYQLSGVDQTTWQTHEPKRLYV